MTINNVFEVLKCTKCNSRLHLFNNSLLCDNRHCYDISKEGYVNLLLVNKKKSKQPGDDELMITARDEFLNKGYYDEIIKNICNIDEFKKLNIKILDAGCGSGYYLDKICQNQNLTGCIGVDISKYAIKKASKNDKKNFYCVASLFDLPIQDQSVDVILNIFAPKANEEFNRVLKQDGLLIEVIPGKEHLKELKQLLYKDKYTENEEKFALNLKFIDSNRVKYSKELGKEDILNLFKMTPYWHSTSFKDKTNMLSIESLNITFDFIINLWRNL